MLINKPKFSQWIQWCANCHQVYLYLSQALMFSSMKTALDETSQFWVSWNITQWAMVIMFHWRVCAKEDLYLVMTEPRLFLVFRVLSNFPFILEFLFFNHWFKRQNYIEIERERHREKIYHPQVHSPNDHNSQAGAGWNQDHGTLSGSLLWWQGSKFSDNLLLLSQKY